LFTTCSFKIITCILQLIVLQSLIDKGNINRRDVQRKNVVNNVDMSSLKQLSSRCSKNKKWIKLTVNTGQVIFSGEIYYYGPLNTVDK